MEKELLAVKGLSVSVEDKPILDHVNLEIGTGEIHVLMGPNGTGKSTLGYTLMGSPRYHVTEGQIMFKGKDRQRARQAGHVSVLPGAARSAGRDAGRVYPQRGRAANRQPPAPVELQKGA